MDKLPVYEMVIEQSTTSDIGVSFVALVDRPAIEKNFMAFNAVKLHFSADEEKKIISGPAMVADSLIYRKDENGEYNVFFSKKTIEEIALKFFKMDYQKNLNLFHDPKLSLEGVTIFESFVTDSVRGIQPMKGFEEVPDGTWFISCKVENDAVWEKIKSGELKGFSIEGIFTYSKVAKPADVDLSEILSWTVSDYSHLSKTDIMKSIKTAVEKFKAQFFNTGEPGAGGGAGAGAAAKKDWTLKDGTLVSIDKLEVGGVVMVGETPAVAGDYELTDGTKLTVGEAGVITAVTPAPAIDDMNKITPEQQMQAVKEAVKKFAAGTPEERIANIEIVAKALMEYNFGWEIRRQEEEAARTAAINIYKTGFENHKTEFNKKLDNAEKTIAKQQTIIAGLFELIEQIGELSSAAPIDDQRQTSLSTNKKQGKEALVKSLAERLKNISNSKTG